MHYNAVTHTQKAIQNLRSEVKIFFKRNQEQGLPHISKKSKYANFAEILLPLRNYSKSRQRYDNQSVIQSPNQKIVNTISFSQEIQKQKINVTIIKPKVIKRHKITLPKFIKDSKTYQNQNKMQSLQNMEISLVQETNLLNRSTHKRFMSQKNSPKKRGSVQIQKNITYIVKTGRCQKTINQSMPSISIDKVCSNRQSCYSPWQKDQDNQLLQQF